jgi:hypothetical protein
LLTVVVAALLAIGFLGAVTALVVWLADRHNIGPEVALSLQFVAAAVLLILVICILVIVFQRLGLVDRSRAMGLPDGSIRAIIALLLIVLFFLAALFLFEATQHKPDATVRRSLQGITSERLAGIPTEEILSLQTRIETDTTVYDVELSQAPTNTADSTDIAKQLVTVLGTLVTAVAAFYFGANSVSAAASRAARETSQALGAQAAGGGSIEPGHAPPGGSGPTAPGAGPQDPGTEEAASGEDSATAPPPTPAGPDDTVATEAAPATDGAVAPLDVNDPSVGDLEAEPAPQELPDAPDVEDSQYDPANSAIDPDTRGETDDPDTPGASGPPPDPSAGGEDI